MKDKLQRRGFLGRAALLVASSIAIPSFAKNIMRNKKSTETETNPILGINALGFTWETADPFLFCVHHEDAFPKGDDNMAPDAKYLNGRNIGEDFIIKDGFRMYHGKTVPGFPGHPHRGFETITVVRKGVVDHADSLGASGRYGNGDVQWMTAGKGVQHSEMFPLVNKDKDNPMELFQIWLNLPKKNKMVEPHFKMFWKESIENLTFEDTNKKKTIVEVIAGELDSKKAPVPPPDSWANPQDNEVAIWNFAMEAGATFTLPKASKGVNRTIYFYEGDNIKVEETTIEKYHSAKLLADVEVTITAGDTATKILLLQGKPINEPVIQYGPFVMNTKQEIHDAFEEYHKTQFGGWPWPNQGQVHDRELTRFAKYADGAEEIKKP
jgi:hypothetical protein